MAIAPDPRPFRGALARRLSITTAQFCTEGEPVVAEKFEGGPGTPSCGVPTARRVDHTALTVPDLGVAVQFFTSVLGGELVYRLPALAHDDDWMAERLDVHPRAVAEIALVRLGPTSNVELFQYSSPDQVRDQPAPHHIGAHHLGLLVDDIDEALAYFRGHGLQVLGEPRVVPPGEANAGLSWARIRTPWGLVVEIRSWQGGQSGAAPTAPRFTAPRFWTNGEAGTQSPPRVPTARGVDHLAYCVADLDAAETFFVHALGAEPLGRTGPISLSGGLAAAHGVPDDATAEHSVLRFGPTDNLELWSYRTSESARPCPRNSDIGGRHLALAVEDVDAAAAHLRDVPGVTLLGLPETITSGPIAGDRWVYLRTPIGLHLELVNMPDGSLPYERETSARRRSARADRWHDR